MGERRFNLSAVSRRDALRLTAATLGAGVGGTTRTVATETDRQSNPAIGTERLADGFYSPVAMAVPPNDDRIFVCDQVGTISIYTPDGLRDEPFLDIRDQVVTRIREGYSEQGLLGLAFHPNFQQNGKLYVRYSGPPRDEYKSYMTHTFVLSEFTVGEQGRVDPATERQILTIPEPGRAHNAGAIVFGPDGYLYVGVGDGGHENDMGNGHASDWYDAVDGGNGQDVTQNLHGSILRIDVDRRDGERGYAVPPDNPLVGREGLDEQFAWGLRNPWKLSFNDGELFAADVGQSHYEEINIIERGANYGWNVKEGGQCFKAKTCPEYTPADVRGGEPLRDPIVEYPHKRDGELVGIATVGGYVYERTAIEGLGGTYVFGDWNQGNVFAAVPPEGSAGEEQSLSLGTVPWTLRNVRVAKSGKYADKLGRRLQSFGRDNDGRLYMLTQGKALGTDEPTGDLRRIVPPGEV